MDYSNMADGGDNVLVGKFKEFCKLAGAKDPCQMTSKACGKMVADCLDKDYKKYDVKAIVDASVFPACKEKGKPHMAVNTDNCKKLIDKTAHEIAKKKTKNTKLAADDPEVVAIKADLCMCISGGGPQVKAVKQSVTGNVDALTDASHFTGAHKERFDADGKGKGAAGREDIVDTSGYVGNYTNKGSFGM